MWKAPVLLLVLGSAWLWVPAQGAITGQLEDDLVTPGAKDDSATPAIEDNIVTTGTTEEFSASSGPTALAPTNAESRTDVPIEDLPTQEGSVHTQEESHSTTVPDVATSRSKEKVAEETETTVEKDGLATVTLVGIIIGVLLAIGFIGCIIFVVVRKMSGGYSP
ncbi:podoplanin isoform X1 [Marmota marmota marmota]|uniref:podoplanin isoform X1 n=1 Tax=Marmota marmota marmota TaxID=9994 RepID=UPI0007627A3C|nr:podoplanin isoform X1 [Marmota marmota marmota]